MFKYLPTREEGQGLVEYVLIFMLVAIVVIAILVTLGSVVGDILSNTDCNSQDDSCEVTDRGSDSDRVEELWVWGDPTVDGYAELGLTGGSDPHYVWLNSSSLTADSMFWVSTSSNRGPNPTTT